MYVLIVKGDDINEGQGSELHYDPFYIRKKIHERYVPNAQKRNYCLVTGT